MDPTTNPTRAHNPNPTTRQTPSSGGREDCWSEGATGALITAWGDRYVSLNRGNLRQKDWKEVADAVNARQNGIRPRKTGIQCKNRIDTLKKKYKTEKTKPPPSSWTFFSRLDSLIGTNASNSTNHSANAFRKVKLSVRKPLVPSKQELRSSVSDSTESSGDELGGFDDERAVKKKQRVEEVGEGGACRELARAILRFGEIYERVESSKQERMVELERERMEFAKEIDFERMNMFVDAQLELERRARTGEERKRRRVGKHAPSGSAKKL